MWISRPDVRFESHHTSWWHRAIRATHWNNHTEGTVTRGYRFGYVSDVYPSLETSPTPYRRLRAEASRGVSERVSPKIGVP